MNKVVETLWVTFDWPIEPAVRHKIEDVLKKSGYKIHGGGTNIIEKTADISLHKE
ncbi:MAG: hypothetical protein QMD92_00295 [bacterium]|nr:hypothetical protein [bacterium]